MRGGGEKWSVSVGEWSSDEEDRIFGEVTSSSAAASPPSSLPCSSPDPVFCTDQKQHRTALTECQPPGINDELNRSPCDTFSLHNEYCAKLRVWIIHQLNFAKSWLIQDSTIARKMQTSSASNWVHVASHSLRKMLIPASVQNVLSEVRQRNL